MSMDADKKRSIEVRLIRIIASTIHHDPNEIKPAATIESLGLDSITVMELVYSLEHELGLSVPRTIFYECKSIADLVVWFDGQRKI